MKATAVLAALLVAALPAMPAEKPAPTRAALAALETSFDGRVARLGQEEPFDLLGNTRGIYLEGFGVVFTTELSPIVTPGVSPFRPSIPKEMVEKIHQKKLERIPLLKQAMREMLVSAAAALEALPAGEQVAVGVTLFYYSWEDRSGLPSQILMQAPKSRLLDLHPGQSAEAPLPAAIRLREF
jgi:hypothetical protein